MIKKIRKIIPLFLLVLAFSSKSSLFSYDLTDNTFIVGDWEPDAYDRADGRAYVQGAVKLSNLNSDNGEYVTAKIFGGGFERLDMTDANGKAAQLNLESNLHIYGDLLGSGTFSKGTGSDIEIYFHVSQGMFGDQSFTFTGNGLYILDLMENGLYMFDSARIQLQRSDVPVPLTVGIHNGIFYNSSSNWLNYSGTGYEAIYFRNIEFQGDPGLGLAALDSTKILSFDGLDNKFNAGFTLPRDCEIKTKHQFSGALDLNGHALTLQSNIILAADGSLSDAHRATFEADDDANNRTIFFNASQSFENVLSFSSDMILDGNNNTIDLNNVGQITVAPGKSLTLKNITLRNLSSDWFSGGGSLIPGEGMGLVY